MCVCEGEGGGGGCANDATSFTPQASLEQSVPYSVDRL